MKEKLLRNKAEIIYGAFVAGYLLSGVLAYVNSKGAKRHA